MIQDPLSIFLRGRKKVSTRKTVHADVQLIGLLHNTITTKLDFISPIY